MLACTIREAGIEMDIEIMEEARGVLLGAGSERPKASMPAGRARQPANAQSPVRAVRDLLTARVGARVGAWTARHAHRGEMLQLSRLDDHLLRDIGVTRDDVWRLQR
jgi:uncharacterized protein YjiS (DUF1127 family)